MPSAAFAIVASSTVLNHGYCQLQLRIQDGQTLPQPQPGQYLQGRPQNGRMLTLPVMMSTGDSELMVMGRISPPPASGSKLLALQLNGTTLTAATAAQHIVIACENTALACAVFAASRLRLIQQTVTTVFAQFDHAAPFRSVPSQILLPGCPPGVIAAVPLLDDWNIASRLASPVPQNGFFQGMVCDLLNHWYEQHLKDTGNQRIQLLGCGSEGFIEELRRWCETRGIDIQTSHVPSC